MITAQKLLDALEYLPDDLLQETERLRRKKPIPWRSLTALAACLCLCLGLWSFLSSGLGANNAAGEADRVQEHSSSTGTKIAEYRVYEVADDHITAINQTNIPQPPNTDGLHIQIAQIYVSFENLEQIPVLESGQKIRVYYDTFHEDDRSISPYRIEIIDEQEVNP